LEEYRKISDVVEELGQFDGVFFRIVETSPHQYVWKMTVIDFTENGNKVPEYIKSKFGYDRYRIIYLNNDDTVEYVECALLDVKYFLKNLLETNQEVFLVRDCEEAEQITKQFFVNRMTKLLLDCKKEKYDIIPQSKRERDYV
jgi:hypothetical protein